MEGSYLLLILILTVGHMSANNRCHKSVTTASGIVAPKGPYCSGDLIFEDSFDVLNLRTWQHELTLGGGGHNEFQWYANNRSNSYVEDGVLHIRPTLLADDYGSQFLYTGTLDINGGDVHTGCTNPLYNGCKRKGNTTHILNPIKSARIRTIDSFAFKYGKAEIRAKLPTGDWLWPAIWLLPKYKVYSNWPASGEIDIMESRGNKLLYNSTGDLIGIQQVASTLNWGPNKAYNKWRTTYYLANDPAGFHSDYHKYQLVWGPDSLEFLIDDISVGEVNPPEGGFWRLGNFTDVDIENPWKCSKSKMAPFDEEFYFIINVAVGGLTFFSDTANNLPEPKPWLNNASAPLTDFWENRQQWIPTWNMNEDDSHFRVDYVKVWAL